MSRAERKNRYYDRVTEPHTILGTTWKDITRYDAGDAATRIVRRVMSDLN